MEGVLICPVCRAPLARQGGSYICEGRHTFDRARQGYTNLLLRPAGQHGDNRGMILARRAFLEGGAYAPLRDAICGAARRLAPEAETFLDAGCGEGYYGEAVLRALPHAAGYGIDISREALRVAGRRETVASGRFSLFVAGVYEMPFADRSFDLVLNVFAPLAAEEYRRVLRPGGILLMAIPDRRHLFEMKEVLYDAPRENEVADFALDGFTFLGAEPVRNRFTLRGQEQIDALFSMTPYYYRTPEAGRQRLAALGRLDVTAEFLLLSYRLGEMQTGT